MGTPWVYIVPGDGLVSHPACISVTPSVPRIGSGIHHPWPGLKWCNRKAFTRSQVWIPTTRSPREQTFSDLVNHSDISQSLVSVSSCMQKRADSTFVRVHYAALRHLVTASTLLSWHRSYDKGLNSRWELVKAKLQRKSGENIYVFKGEKPVENFLIVC